MEWAAVVSHPHYAVSNTGEIRKADGVPIGQWLSGFGYKRVRLSRPRKICAVHRLVAEAFIPNPKNLPSINHLNNNRADNRVENLEWCTQAQNIAHAHRQGRMCLDYWVGKRSPWAKLSDEQVAEIRRVRETTGMSWEKLGIMFGMSKRAIGRCLKKETYADVQ